MQLFHREVQHIYYADIRVKGHRTNGVYVKPRQTKKKKSTPWLTHIRFSISPGHPIQREQILNADGSVIEGSDEYVSFDKKTGNTVLRLEKKSVIFIAIKHSDK